MKQILFVDDQPEVLNGIKRMLFDKTDQWDMVFVESAELALQALEAKSFDVVVSDMRMPGMDGADLLNEVAHRHPFIIRIILSGHSEQEMIMKSVRATHQFLAKPLNGQRLQGILKKAFGLRELLNDPALMSIVATMDALPSLPNVYYELMQELQKPDVTMTEIGLLIAKDIGMTAKLMQLVNSSFFGLPVHISDPVHAAKLLGADILKGLVLSVHIFSRFENLDLPGFSIEDFTEHSLTVAALAKKIAATISADKKMIDTASIAGMLHDIGKLILAKYKTDEYKQALAMAKEKHITESQAEKTVLNTSHAEIGAYLLGIWGLPDDIIECAAYHHHAGACVNSHATPLTAVYIADTLLNDCGQEINNNLSTIDMKYLQELNLETKMPEWQQIYENQCEVIAADG